MKASNKGRAQTRVTPRRPLWLSEISRHDSLMALATPRTADPYRMSTKGT